MKKKYIISFSLIGLIIISLLTIPNAVSTASSATTKKLPIYCVETDKKQVAISFDAAWGNEDTRNILDILKKYDIRATFFMTGGWIEKYPEDVRAIAADGHDLGNHSMNHKEMSTLSYDECIEEITKPHKMVKELTGKEMILFRPPYGDYNDTLIDAANTSGYYPIQWDVDSLDWKNYGVDSIINTVCGHSHLGNGSIVLMHNGGKYTKDALEQVITGLQDAGYEIVPISELIIKDDFYLDHEGRQHSNLPVESKLPSPSPEA